MNITVLLTSDLSSILFWFQLLHVLSSFSNGVTFIFLLCHVMTTFEVLCFFRKFSVLRISSFIHNF